MAVYEEEKQKKKKLELVSPTASFSLFCGDIAAMACSFVFAKKTMIWIRDLLDVDVHSYSLLSNIYLQDILFIIIYPLILLTFFVRGHYSQRVPWWSQVQQILVICMVAFVFDGFIRFALDVNVSRLMIGLSWIYLFFFTLLARQISYIFVSRMKEWRIPTVAIGDSDTITNLLFAFHTDQYVGYDVDTVLLRDRPEKTLDTETLPSRYKDIHILRDNIDHKNYIKDNLDHFFIVALETFRGIDRDEIIRTLTEADALYAIVPPTSRINTYEMEPQHFFGYDLMLFHARPPFFSPLGRFLKRAMDITASGLALLLLAPVVLIVALCLKLEGQGGSVFYGGHRIGRYGQRFKCWKFRSMEPNSDHLLHALLERDQQAKSDWELYRKLKQPDPRITTKTARIIRKTSIDELPQLWNVFIGDMSLVGPRPILENEAELFGDNLNHYLKVRPGITGLWQVSGRNDTSFQRRVYWDSWYVRNWSVWGDIVILIKTLGVVFGGRGAF